MSFEGLEKLARAAERLDGTHSIPFDELFNAIFMLENTNFGSMSEFFDASPFVVKTQEDFDSIDENALDQFIRDKTSFQSWDEMKTAAGQMWFKKRFKEECK